MIFYFHRVIAAAFQVPLVPSKLPSSHNIILSAWYGRATIQDYGSAGVIRP